jgi:16S rRNA (adenine1518-N6/adenine1519-N6)-dimethyltransferase
MLNKPELLQQQQSELYIKQLKADKDLGQHFLIDKEICDKIALSCGDLRQAMVVEIGPGTGALTQSILALHPGVELLVIEKDSRFVPILNKLKEQYKEYGSYLTILLADILKVDILSLVAHSNKDLYLIANLPYNIGSELLFQWFEGKFLVKFKAISVMLQKEVVDRVTAAQGSKNYSWLSIVAKTFAEAEMLFDIPPIAFNPQPKVISSLLYLQSKVVQPEFDYHKLQNICKKLFLYKRKTLKVIIKKDQYLSSLLKIAEEWGLNMQLRPEDLDLNLLYKLSLINL